MASIPAKKFEGMHDDRANGNSFVDTAMGPIISNPSVYLASVALTTCMTVGQDRGAKHDILIRLLGSAMERWPGFRGPRTATQTAIMTTGITLDDRDAKLEYPGVHRSFGGGGGSRSGGGDGVIGQLKPSGKTVTVEFKKQMVKQVQCAQVKYTNRVTQIRPDGTLIYESTCVKNETVIVEQGRPSADGERALSRGRQTRDVRLDHRGRGDRGAGQAGYRHPDDGVRRRAQVGLCLASARSHESQTAVNALHANVPPTSQPTVGGDSHDHLPVVHRQKIGGRPNHRSRCSWEPCRATRNTPLSRT